jgi:hypothetical protein
VVEHEPELAAVMATTYFYGISDYSRTNYIVKQKSWFFCCYKDILMMTLPDKPTFILDNNMVSRIIDVFGAQFSMI